ncbi:glycosidase [Anaerotaenia torta]|uniref:alpha-amylase family glycosyl hydrolase n=1 Tax=Anaerotaenia torta TaxID=433293 RepID=UPI003D1AB674
MQTLNNRLLNCSFCNTNHTLSEVKLKDYLLPWDGFAFDFGCNEVNQTGILEYDSMLNFRTWNLPAIRPTRGGSLPSPVSFEIQGSSATATYQINQCLIRIIYRLTEGSLNIDAELENQSSDPLYLNTFSFIMKLKELEGVVFDFPGNVPMQHFEASKLEPYQVIETGLISFATHTRTAGGDFNLLFIDPIEKWSSGVYHDGTCVNYVFSAGLEADLAPGATLSVGTLYLQLCEAGNPYLQIREFVEALGYKPCEGGITEGVMYSCHPSGTMDAGFPLKDDLFRYAEYLPELKEMGVDHVWLLPVFEHDENGVYHSNDQSIIDERYGGEEGCKYYCDKAHELGMTILFDYVPHGPAPEFPVARDNPEWPSKRRDGSLQDEWECVSMDYNHPGYYEYTAELVHDHVKRFGVDGARIDCAMGGLSNWRPYKDNRPSGNSVKAGVSITNAIRDGFLRGGKQSFILPENFNPIPNYYHCTDLFYDMTLYRVFVEIEHFLKEQPAEYVRLLTDFLERQSLVSPANYHKLRYLGNHDTVSWVFQSRRAVDCYGAGGAKALWAVISLIDGMPMIYQGDEDPSIYGGEGPKLTEFFTRLFADRKKYIPAGSNETAYLKTGTPVMAFLRGEKGNQVLVTINLSNEEQVFDLNAYPAAKALLKDKPADHLGAYDYQIYRI